MSMELARNRMAIRFTTPHHFVRSHTLAIGKFCVLRFFTIFSFLFLYCMCIIAHA